MSKELKMCPFCGGRAVMKAANKKYGFTIWCQCRKCGAKTRGIVLMWTMKMILLPILKGAKIRLQRYGITG